MGVGFSSKKDTKYTIIFDLDGTLIKSFKYQPLGLSNKIVVEEKDLWVVKRPGVDNLLKFCESNYNIGIWSSGGEQYVNNVVKECFNINFLNNFIMTSP